MKTLLTFKELREHDIPFSRRHLLRLEDAGRFPKRVKLGPKSIAWDSKEIEAWLKARKEER